MVIFLGLRWWYSDGWLWIYNNAITVRLKKWISYFSMPNLARTLFKPFKQNYGRSRKGGLDAIIQVALDNFVSRVIGFLARSVLLFIGLICIFIVLVSGLLILLIWPLIPALPILSILLASEAIP